MGVQYFPGFWSCLRAHQQEWCQLCLIVFILSSFYFLIIFTNFPFCLRLAPLHNDDDGNDENEAMIIKVQPARANADARVATTSECG